MGTTFATGPAGLPAKLTPDFPSFHFWLILILLYDLCAAFLPIDKIIGKLYPIFGICLIIMALGVGGGLLVKGCEMPELWDHFYHMDPAGKPIWPMMFVSLACGSVSGFHATQPPMMARCITSEKEGRTVFCGVMVAPEGFRLNDALSYPAGIIAAVLFFLLFWWRTMIVHKNDVNQSLHR